MTYYSCSSSVEADRPQIDFTDNFNRRNDWLLVGEVLDGVRPANEFPSVRIEVGHPEATSWDCYMVAGTIGLFSHRFVEAVGPEALREFTLFPAGINNVTYYFPRCERRIDCFDREKSTYMTFRSSPSRIRAITHYAFFENRIPAEAMFCIPEVPDLYATEGTVRRMVAAGLRGISNEPLL